MSKDALRDAIVTGLRKCRHEDAPIPLINEYDLGHISHMVAVEVREWMESQP